jgi:hypothetical protein
VSCCGGLGLLVREPADQRPDQPDVVVLRFLFAAFPTLDTRKPPPPAPSPTADYDSNVCPDRTEAIAPVVSARLRRGPGLGGRIVRRRQNYADRAGLVCWDERGSSGYERPPDRWTGTPAPVNRPTEPTREDVHDVEGNPGPVRRAADWEGGRGD